MKSRVCTKTCTSMFAAALFAAAKNASNPNVPQQRNVVLPDAGILLSHEKE